MDDCEEEHGKVVIPAMKTKVQEEGVLGEEPEAEPEESPKEDVNPFVPE